MIQYIIISSEKPKILHHYYQKIRCKFIPAPLLYIDTLEKVTQQLFRRRMHTTKKHRDGGGIRAH